MSVHQGPHQHPAFAALEAKGFDILFLSHAKSILSGEFPDALTEIASVLDAIELPINHCRMNCGGVSIDLQMNVASIPWSN